MGERAKRGTHIKMVRQRASQAKHTAGHAIFVGMLEACKVVRSRVRTLCPACTRISLRWIFHYAGMTSGLGCLYKKICCCCLTIHYLQTPLHNFGKQALQTHPRRQPEQEETQQRQAYLQLVRCSTCTPLAGLPEK